MNDSLRQQFWEAGLAYTNSNWANISYSFRNFQTENEYDGLKNVLGLSINPGIVNIDFNASHLSTKESEFNSTFYRHKTLAKVRLKPFSIGVEDEFEDNSRNQNDSLLSKSYRFYDYKAFIESPFSSNASP